MSVNNLFVIRDSGWTIITNFWFNFTGYFKMSL